MTRVCPDCGNALTDPDEQFCGNCGCYLEWTEPDAPPEPEPAPVAEEPAAPAGFAQRVRAALGGDDAPVTPPAESPTAAVPAPPPPMPAAPLAPPAPAAGPPTSPPPTGPPPARPPSVPAPRRSVQPPNQAPAQALVAPQQPGPQQPGPQQPQARRPGSAAPAARRQTVAPPEPLNPGDLVCGQCGIGNKPTRKFCRRCGQDLVDAPKAKVSLLRRVFKPRTPKVKEAGARPRRAGSVGRARPRVPTRLVGLVAVLAALGLGSFFLRGAITDAIGIVQDKAKGEKRIIPDKVTASSAQQGHGANLVRDGTPNKYWAPGKPGDGTNEYVETSFEDPVRLIYVLVTPGVSSSDEELFQQQGRPAELKLDVTREDGTHEVKTVDISDQRGAQRVSVRESDVTSVRFVITEAYAGNVDGSRTAIGEIEFVVRK